jgi:hypothetical protein
MKRQSKATKLKTWFASLHPSGFLLAAQLLLLILYALFDDLSSQWELR